MMPLEIELPVPPPLNHAYYHRGNVLVKTEEMRQYGQRVFARILPMLERNGLRWVPRFPDGDVAVEVAWYRDKKQGDVDGRLKVLLDALQKLAYTNDRQIAHLSIWRHDRPFDGEPRLEVQIRAL